LGSARPRDTIIMSSRQAIYLLFQDRESGVEDVVIDPGIDRASEAVGDVEKLIAETDLPLSARFDSQTAAHIDQKIQSCCAAYINGDGLTGGDDAPVGLQERIQSAAAAKVSGKPEGCYRESINGMCWNKLRQILSWLQ